MCTIDQALYNSLKKNLPKGWYKKIADKCQCTPTHIHKVMRGDSKDNRGILKEVVRLYKKEKLRKEKLAEEINSIKSEL